MSELNSLNQSRKGNEGVIIEAAQENQEQARVVPEHKGIYFLSFLMIFLIGFSVISMSISFKTLSQLEAFWTDSKTTLQTLTTQQKDIAALQSLIADRAAEELAQVKDIRAQISYLKIATQNRENEISEMKIAYNDLKASTQGSLEELQLSDKLILKKYILLNDQFQKFSEDNAFILNMY